MAAFRKKGQGIDLVLLDVGMPGMGGRLCLQQLLEMDPSARVIIVSGYSPIGGGKASTENGAKGYIKKPYRMGELLQTVRRVLDE